MPSQALCGLFFLDNKEEKAQSLSEHDCLLETAAHFPESDPSSAWKALQRFALSIYLTLNLSLEAGKSKLTSIKLAPKKKKNRWRGPRAFAEGPLC